MPEQPRPTITALVLIALLAAPAMARADGWAMDGYDPVTLRDDHRAVAGQGQIVTRWHGKLWHFTTEANRAAFEANPRAYAPALGGLCPDALAQGRRVEGDPRHFVIIDGQLYLARSAQALRRIMAAPGDILGRAGEAFAHLR